MVVAGITSHPDQDWMEQVARSAIQETWGHLHPCHGLWPNSSLIIMAKETTGTDNKLLFPDAGEKLKKPGHSVECRHRLGGLLKYYGRAA